MTIEGFVQPRRKRLDWVPLAMLALAVLVHVTLLFTLIVYGVASAARTEFFSAPQPMTLDEVSVVPPPVLRKAAPPRAAVRPPRPVRTTPPRVAVRPAPAALPHAPARRPAAAPVAMTAPRAGGPAVLSAPNGGPAVPRSGGGMPDGRGGDAGAAAAGGDGGGAPSGSGAQDGGGAPRPSLWLQVEYHQTGALDVLGQNLTLNSPQGVDSWDALCRTLGLRVETLASHPHISPFLVRFQYVFRNAAERDALIGQRGVVRVRVTVDPAGTPQVSMVSSSGNAVMDVTALLVMQRTSRWLPALEYGRPVVDTVEMDVTFTDVPQRSGITLTANPNSAAPAAGGLGGTALPPVSQPGGAGQAPVSDPGGAGQAPGDVVPGGAGQRPGSW